MHACATQGKFWLWPRLVLKLPLVLLRRVWVLWSWTIIKMNHWRQLQSGRDMFVSLLSHVGELWGSDRSGPEGWRHARTSTEQLNNCPRHSPHVQELALTMSCLQLYIRGVQESQLFVALLAKAFIHDSLLHHLVYWAIACFGRLLDKD